MRSEEAVSFERDLEEGKGHAGDDLIAASDGKLMHNIWYIIHSGEDCTKFGWLRPLPKTTRACGREEHSRRFWW